MTPQPCPLCDQQATFEISHRPYCKHFECPQCTSYFIDASSEAYIAGLPEVTKSEVRENLSHLAKVCAADYLFVIRAPRNDELGGDGRSVARVTMKSEYLRKNSDQA